MDVGDPLALGRGVAGAHPLLRVRARSPDGTPAATLYLYGSNLPAGLLAMVTRGPLTHFKRMARLVEPGRREAAILFADVEASGKLSRRLPSSSYFDFIRDFSTTSDDVIIDGGGIVGDHAGDGVTAFFVVGDFGSASARGAGGHRGRPWPAGRHERAGAAVGLGAGEVLRVGVHWGGRCTWARWSPAGGSRSPRWATRSTSAPASSSRPPAERCWRPRR